MASKKKTVKKASKKKKVPARKTRRAPAAPKEKPFRLEVGKLYESRCGRFKAKITSENKVRAYQFDGEWIGAHPVYFSGVNGPSLTGWTSSGFTMLDNEPRDTDLVREVKQVKKG